MRAILIALLLVVSAHVSFCQVYQLSRDFTGDPWWAARGQRQRSQEAWELSIQLTQEQKMAAWQNYVPEDPYRIIDGTRVYAKGDHWMKFGGRIVEILPTGIRIRGTCKSLNDPFRYYTFSGEFFVANFPYTNHPLILHDANFSTFTAKEAGTYSLSESNIIPQLEYGVIAEPPPPSAEGIEFVVNNAEAVVLHEQHNKESDAKALKWNQDQAAKGDEYGQLRMGERYLTGDGVEKDLDKAREYFSKAAAKGSVRAAEMLKKLSP
jgi:hypothetical protein